MDSESDSDFEVQKKTSKPRPSSEDLFDSMMSGGSSKPIEISSDDTPVKKGMLLRNQLMVVAGVNSTFVSFWIEMASKLAD